MIIAIGEILYDIFPDKKRIGGAPFNFSFHVDKLKEPVHFITRIGDDANGRAIAEYIRQCGLHSTDIQVDPDYPTGSVIVSLDDAGHPEFDIVGDTAYDHLIVSPDRIPFKRDQIDLVYFGTLAQRTPRAFTAIQKFLGNTADITKRFYDINLRPGCYNAEIIFESLKKTDILKLNTLELQYLAETVYNTTDTDQTVMLLMENFDIQTVALTRGEDGSILYMQDGRYEQPASPIKVVGDTVGAGDAYAAVLAIGILQAWKPDRILSSATAFAAEICGIKGAIPSDDTLYKSITRT